jgi:mannosyltransferase OCH1-like enzyme
MSHITKKINEYTEHQEFSFYNKPCTFLKSEYKCIIPCNIYQTWYTKDLPPKMKSVVDLLKSQNPEFKHYLFDDNDCREFIKNNFGEDVLNAYNSLIPGAYKADLWRYCVLFINGGIYMDIKNYCVNDFKLISLCESEHFTLDRPENSLYNGLMVCKPKNIVLLRAIRQIVENVKNKYYGTCPLEPTGPRLLGSVVIKNNININNFIDSMFYNDENGRYILYKNRFIINTDYPEYNDEKINTYKSINTERYDKLWEKRGVYA